MDISRESDLLMHQLSGLYCEYVQHPYVLVKTLVLLRFQPLICSLFIAPFETVVKQFLKGRRSSIYVPSPLDAQLEADIAAVQDTQRKEVEVRFRLRAHQQIRFSSNVHRSILLIFSDVTFHVTSEKINKMHQDMFVDPPKSFNSLYQFTREIYECT